MTLAAVRPAENAENQALGIALLLAAALHALFILGLGFYSEPPAPPATERTLEVVLINRAEPETPARVDHPDFFAQTSVQGSGEDPVAKTTPTASAAPPQVAVEAVAPEIATSEGPPAAQPVPALEVEPAPAEHPPKTTTEPPFAVRAPHKTVVPEPPPAAPPRSKTRATAAQILASRGTEVAEITAQLDKKVTAYAQRERRRAISASTQEYKYAAYLDAWRLKVERIGNLNYPEEAKRRKLYGNLVLQVAVRSDGSVEQIRVVHSSGSSVLDDAAVRIVHLAAPFAPFPADVRAETDVLDITRTWQFLNSDRLSSDK
jgi:periplasmic protein TonB